MVLFSRERAPFFVRGPVRHWRVGLGPLVEATTYSVLLTSSGANTLIATSTARLRWRPRKTPNKRGAPVRFGSNRCRGNDAPQWSTRARGHVADKDGVALDAARAREWGGSERETHAIDPDVPSSRCRGSGCGIRMEHARESTSNVLDRPFTESACGEIRGSRASTWSSNSAVSGRPEQRNLFVPVLRDESVGAQLTDGPASVAGECESSLLSTFDWTMSRARGSRCRGASGGQRGRWSPSASGARGAGATPAASGAASCIVSRRWKRL